MEDDRLNILVLHRLGDPQQVRHFLWNHVYFLKKYAPNHNYIFHNVYFDFPQFLRGVNFHAIILDVTFLCIRWLSPNARDSIIQEYLFLFENEAVKIALPQDDYDYSAVLDEWMCLFGVDVVYTVCPDHWDILYPKYSKIGKIKLGYTGYLDESLLNISSSKPYSKREFDVGYRASRLPYYIGRMREIKSKLGELFLQHASGQGLVCNISNNPKDTLYGVRWLDFIGNCKFVLGSNSGSSILDANGEIRSCVKKYVEIYPDASFEEVEAECFPGLDEVREFTAISPRLIEASLLRSGQVLIEGPYSGIVVPWEHYIPLKKDFSNKNVVFEAMRDKPYCEKLINNCYEEIIYTPRLRYSYHADEILSDIRSGVTMKGIVGTNDDVMKKIVVRYNYYIKRFGDYFWRNFRRRKKLESFIVNRCPPVYKLLLKLRNSL